MQLVVAICPHALELTRDDALYFTVTYRRVFRSTAKKVSEKVLMLQDLSVLHYQSVAGRNLLLGAEFESEDALVFGLDVY